MLRARLLQTGGGYKVKNSLRFNDDDSAYLSRTPASAGNRKTWTWSGWVKRGAVTELKTLFMAYQGTSSIDGIYFEADDTLICLLNPGGGNLTTTRLFRDPSSHCHIVLAVDTTQATASNRVKLYINGTLVTAFNTEAYPSQNYDCLINSSAYAHAIGTNLNGPQGYFDGLLSEVNFIDGQALDASYFGKTDAVTGAWVPKKYSGSYGTNGFYLDFKDATSTTTLGYDRSGNGNNWTLNNLATTDQMTDTPTNNYWTWNVIEPYPSGFIFNDGSLRASNSTDNRGVRAPALPSSGKWYWEITAEVVSSMGIGVCLATCSLSAATYADSTNRTYGYNGNKYDSGTTAYGATYTSNDVIGVAVDMDTGIITFYKNGVSQGQAFSDLVAQTWFPYVTTHAPASNIVLANFGQRPFAYTPPTGFKSLCTANLPVPSIKKPSKYFNAKLRTGTGAAFSVAGELFQPDLVWTKGRSGATDHAFYDSTRGVEKRLESNNTDAEVTGDTTGLTAFNSDGFSGGALAQINTNAATYVDWMFKKGVTPGFDIVGYTGDGAAGRTVAHSLGVVPSLIFVKNRVSGDGTWCTYHKDVDASPANYFMKLNSQDAKAAVSTIWNNTVPTSSVFSLGTNGSVNENGSNHVAYLFAEVPGFSRIGKYTGNGSADGPFVWCGFRPRFVLVRRIDAFDNWHVNDSCRKLDNPINITIYPNLNNAEAGGSDLDFLANGFKVRNIATQMNASGGTYVFIAFAENPFKYARAA